MSMINEKVSHNVFGNGKIIHQESENMSIQFSEPYGVKHFVYPDAFEKYLKLHSAKTEKSVLKDLHDKQEKLEAQRVLKQQEYEAALQNVVSEKTKTATQKKKSPPKAKSPRKGAAKPLEEPEANEE